MAKTQYDKVAYPSAVFQQTNPGRLEVIAHLYGLDPPEIATARVLEIGGSDAMSLLAFAAAYPNAQCCNFDLSHEAIARGHRMVEAAGVTNVTMEVGDIMTARSRYEPKSFDYVIAHGIYAWVPEAVRRETLALIGHVLADNGIAFVSFNAKPGGHVRSILRDMLLYVLDGVEEPSQRIAAMRGFLAEFAEPREDEDDLMKAVRKQAASMLERPDNVLFHDELGPEFAPQQLSEVIAAAETCGLQFLTDAGRNRHLDGFLPEESEEEPGRADRSRDYAAVVRNAQLDDFLTMRFFRQPLFVRAEARPSRRIDADRLAGLFVTTVMVPDKEKGTFHQGKDEIEIPDKDLAASLVDAAAIAPRRVPVDTVASTTQQRRVILQLYAEWYVRLYKGREPFVATPGERPRTSALVRAQIAAGDLTVFSLDFRTFTIDQPELRALLLTADGTRTVAEIAALPDLDFPADQIPAALQAAATRALLSA